MDKLPQNINNLIMEIGEKSVLFRLFLLTKNTDWNVYYNLNGVGFDIALVNQEKNQDLKIEVKTRQRLYTTSKQKHFNYTVTESEYNNMDILICYWYELNKYFILPKKGLSKTSSNNDIKYYIRAGLTKDNRVFDSIALFEDKWEYIIDLL